MGTAWGEGVFLAPIRSQTALAVAIDLNSKIEALIETAMLIDIVGQLGTSRAARQRCASTCRAPSLAASSGVFPCCRATM
jgi:hypothetical protein